MTSFFNGDITTNRSVVNAGNEMNSDQTDAARDFYRFQILNEKVLQTLRPLLINYPAADLNEMVRLNASNNYLITQIDSNSNYDNNKITNLQDFTYDSNLFVTYRKSFKDVLTGLQSAIGQLKTNIELKDDNTELLEYKNILTGNNTSQLIRDYLIQKSAEGIPFDANQIIDLDLDIKPWYSAYLTEYGAPPDGIFDTDKISVIVADLIDKGVITIEEFVADRLY
jgi:hypothetical protein